MPPRPSVASKASRPLSAIFIGNQSNGSNSTNNNGHASSGAISSTPLPDLPEPPSPVDSVGSGLPSPPATNSTGSGSTGDPGSVAVRRPPASMASDHSPASRSSSRLSDELDQDEDQTMRLKIGTNESVLQRARSLAQRNKLQLDKIASSRLGRASSASTASSRSHRHSMPEPSQVLSGSETEREGDSAVFNSTSTSSSSSKSNRVSAPSSPHRPRTAQSGTSSPTRRRKRVSLAFDDSGDDENDINYDRRQDPPRAPTVNLNSAKKTPLGSTRRRSALPREFREGSSDDPITDPQTPYRPPSSTGPTPSTSNSTLGRRSTLRTTRGLSEDYRPSPAPSTRDLPTSPLSASTTPTTPASTTSSTKTNESYDNSPTILARSNTLGRAAAARERRQTLRGGSAESALGSPGGRSLVGEGLRAAGLSRRVGVGTSIRERDRERTISVGVVETRDMDRAGMLSGRSSRASSRRVEDIPATPSPDVFKDGRRVDWSPESTDALARPRREFSRTLPPRASTSMADYSYTSRTRQRHMHTQHSDSEDDHDHDIDEEHEKDREGRRDLQTYKPSSRLNSREASLTRREQSLLERERELGRKERELERERERERAASALGRHTPTPYASSTSTIRERYGSIRRTPGGSTTSSSSSHTHTHSQSQSQSHHSQPSQTQTEHAKLMVDSLTMFESQLHKLSRALHNTTNSRDKDKDRGDLNSSSGPGAAQSPSPSPAPGTHTHTGHIDMLARAAQTLVISAERLNTMLKAGNARALDAQIEAEVEGDDLPPPSSASGNRGGGSLVDVWRRIGGEYREGVRVSDELVRAVTGLLLGVGRVVKEYGSMQASGGYAASEAGSGVYGGGTPRGSPVVHWRSVSLGEEEVRVRVGEEFGRESRRSWEPSLSTGSGGGGSGGHGGGGGMSSAASTSTTGPSTGSREEALRRLAGVRSDSPLARASPAFQAVRELDRLETTASPGIGPGLGLPKVNIPAARRLFAPSQQREMALVAGGGGSGGGGAGAGGSGYDYENDPSPTPVSRTLRVFDRGGGGEVLSPLQQVQQLYQTQSPGMASQHLDGAGTGTLERSRTVTLPSVGQGHHGHVFETPLRRNVTISVPSGGGSGGGGDGTVSSRDRHERRKISVASIATIRAATSNTTNPTTNSSATSSSSASSALHHHQPPGFSTLTTPSGATTAVTLSGGGIAVGMARTESGTSTATSSSSALTSGSSSLYSTTARPTFSRPEGILGLQQQLEGYRKRAESEQVGVGVEGNASDVSSGGGGGEGGGGKRRYGNSISLMTPESERETRRKTYGVGSRVGARVSLEGPTGGSDGGGGRPVVVDLTVNAADRSAAATIAGPGRKERRRTVTDIWPRS